MSMGSAERRRRLRTIVAANPRVVLPEHQKLIFLLVAQIVPELPLVESNLTVVVDEVLVEDGCLCKIVLSVHGSSIAYT